MFSATCAIHYAIDKGANIINTSWGYYSDTLSIILKEAIERAAANKIFIVAAAGNHNKNIDECKHWPASFSAKYDNVLTVAALDGDSLIDFSNYGKESVDFAAQGKDINSSYIYINAAATLSGTSMAAPVITRYIAWLRFQGADYATIKNKLKPNSLPPSGISNFGIKPLRNDVEIKSGPPY